MILYPYDTYDIHEIIQEYLTIIEKHSYLRRTNIFKDMFTLEIHPADYK